MKKKGGSTRTGEDQAIRTMSFPLSARRPIRAFRAEHRLCDTSWFDMHYALELGICMSGGLRRFYGQTELDIQPGQAWLCGAWEPHGFQITSAPCRLVVLVIMPEFLINLRFPEAPDLSLMQPFAAPASARPRVPEEKRPTLRMLGTRLLSTRTGPRPTRLVRLRLLVQETLLTLMEGWAPPPELAAAGADAYARLNPALDMVFGTRQYLTESGAARACGMSRNAFNALFKGMFGVSFARFALRHRIKGAAMDLLQSDQPLKTIALRWGFTDTSHFCHKFRAHYGCAPSEYRRGEGKDEE